MYKTQLDSLKHVNDSLIRKLESISVIKDFHLTNESLNMIVKDITEKDSALEKLWSNSPTIAVALLAAFIALYQVKMNLITAARIKWIEDLRKDIAEYCQTIAEILVQEQVQSNEVKYSIVEKLHEAIVIKQRLTMSLNLDERLHYILNGLVDYLFVNTDKKSLVEEVHINNLSKVMNYTLVVASKIFKTEWTKSKRVLPSFFIVKHIFTLKQKQIIDKQIRDLKFPEI